MNFHWYWLQTEHILESHNYFLQLIFFNWRIIALQYCVGSCHTPTWISHRYTYVPSLLNLPPPSLSHPSRLSQSTGSELPTPYSKFPLAICFTYGNVYASTLLSVFIPLAFLHCVYKSVLSVSPVWPVPSRKIPYYVLMYNICFSLSDSLYPV